MTDWQKVATDLHTELFVALEGVDKIVNHGAPSGPLVQRMQNALRSYEDAASTLPDEVKRGSE